MTLHPPTSFVRALLVSTTLAVLLTACGYPAMPAPSVSGGCVVPLTTDDTAPVALVVAGGTADRPSTEPDVDLDWDGFNWYATQPPGTDPGLVAVRSGTVCDPLREVGDEGAATDGGTPVADDVTGTDPDAGADGATDADAAGGSGTAEGTGGGAAGASDETADDSSDPTPSAGGSPTPSPIPSATTATAAAPVAVPDAATTAEDVSVLVDVLANDLDADGDTLTLVAAEAADSTGGTADVEGDRVRFTPPADASGEFTFRYDVSDGTATDTALVTVTVTPVNDAPVAAADTFTHPGGGYRDVDVRSNDTDVDGDVLRVDDVTQPTRGFARPSDNGRFVEFDDRGEVGGTVTFSYTVVDPTGATSTATVTVRLPPAPN